MKLGFFTFFIFFASTGFGILLAAEAFFAAFAARLFSRCEIVVDSGIAVAFFHSFALVFAGVVLIGNCDFAI